ncbi:restriction endonuclease subunit S [Bacillus sp. ISL-57]|uniref:restriction endonuclease subunit S n=1 Tax=Bacillus sp. ISL-57 TaxID=2819135 RepID=UPI001BE7597A|nr:restriction endonuclease subunit S [Bacillus sp. ISL-57]MBT2719199.1 restriction endonuclease subunit S [Bacillus sp. ISL-57]
MMVSAVKEVREGYNMTEFGEIPIEWNVATLGEVLKVGYGKNQKDVEVEKSDIPILGTGGIIGWARTPLFEKPSVLIGRKGTIDKPQYMEKPFWTIDTLFYTDINIEKNFPKFIYYLFQTIDWYKYNEATGVPSLSATNISKIKHSFPPLKEQQKIAEILSTVDEHIENTDRLITKTKALKKGLMQQLLTRGIVHTEFRQTEFGEIPVEWKVEKFIEITEVLKCGVASTPKYVEEGIPFLSSQNVKENKLILDKYNFISKEYHEELTKKVKPKKSDILYTRVGANFGKATVVSVDWEFSVYVSLTLIRLKEGYNSLFYSYLLNSENYQRMAKGKVFQGGGVPNLNVGEVAKFDMIVPPLNEQIRIAKIFTSVDEQIKIYEQEKEKYSELKKGLMQQLLTGKIRVTV